MVIEIDIDKQKHYSGGIIIAEVKTLESGELIAISFDGSSQSKFCISKDREYFFSQGGSTWQRRRLFKIEWARLHKGKQLQSDAPAAVILIFFGTKRSWRRWGPNASELDDNQLYKE